MATQGPWVQRLKGKRTHHAMVLTLESELTLHQNTVQYEDYPSLHSKMFQTAAVRIPVLSNSMS
jgi:hypothetical protein